MSYQVHFANLAEENQSLTLALLRMKEDSGALEPNEAELLLQIRGPAPPGGYRHEEPEQEWNQQQQQQQRRRPPRRRPGPGPRGPMRPGFSDN